MRTQGGERPLGTTACGGKGSKGRAANDDRPIGAASCRREQHTTPTCQPPPPRMICGSRITYPINPPHPHCLAKRSAVFPNHPDTCTIVGSNKDTPRG